MALKKKETDDTEKTPEELAAEQALAEQEAQANKTPEELEAEQAALKTPQVIDKDADEAAQAEARKKADEDAAALAESKGKEAPAAFVSVKNLRATDFRQPSTGLWIAGGETKELKNDGWLGNQVKRGLFELSK